jgi:ABC-type phosphonate transport system ATPase subunit
LRVRPGESIRRGQVLGLVGNTGSSTEPHLSGAEPSILPTSGAERRQNRLPLALDVVAFP